MVKVFNSQYTFQEGTRLRGLHARLEKKRMYEEGTVLLEHDPPVQVALATLVYKCQLLSKYLGIQHNGLLADVQG